MGSGTVAVYDAHAYWYNDYMSAAAGGYIQRVHATIAELLGPGSGACLDGCCGTGAHAPALAGLGWTPVGVDLSGGQLRHAVRRLPLADLLNAAVAALFGFLTVKDSIVDVNRPGVRSSDHRAGSRALGTAR